MVRNLITGSAGMMGSHLYETLLSHDQEVIPTYHKPTIDSKDNILDDITVILDVLNKNNILRVLSCLLYTSPSPRDKRQSRMPSSA